MTPATSTGRRPRLDRAQVLDAAFAIAGAEGIGAVTIRALAQRLAVTPMALYWHFTDKEALLGAMGERLWDDVVASLAATTPAAEPVAALREVLAAVVAALQRHPHVAPLAPSVVGRCEAGLVTTERSLELLSQLGYATPEAAQVAQLLLLNVVGMVANQPGLDLTDGPDAEAHWRRKKADLLALSPERYPHVVASADHLTACHDLHGYFDLGVDLLVAGVADRAGRPR